MTRAAFEQELTSLINRHCVENGSNTPDFILARHLIECLEAFERASNERERWYGAHLKPFGPVVTEVQQPSGGTPTAVPVV